MNYHNLFVYFFFNRTSIFIIVGLRTVAEVPRAGLTMDHPFFLLQSLRKKEICTFHYFPLWQQAWHRNLLSSDRVSFLKVSTLRSPNTVHLENMKIRSCGGQRLPHVTGSSVSKDSQHHPELSHVPRIHKRQKRLEHQPCLPHSLENRTRMYVKEWGSLYNPGGYQI